LRRAAISIAAILPAVVCLRAEIVDRIAASVDSRVITRSEVELQIRVAAFQDGAKPDLSPKHKRETLETMIDQKLIQRDLQNSRYPLPDPAELIPLVDQFKREHYPGDGQYAKALAEYGISDKDFRDLLLWEKTLVAFIEVRFASTAQLTTQEITDYFEKTVKPAAEAAHPGQQVRLEDYRSQIEEKLAGDRANMQMEAWLGGARRRAQIVIHEEALQ
jgi:hypothetical protein